MHLRHLNGRKKQKQINTLSLITSLYPVLFCTRTGIVFVSVYMSVNTILHINRYLYFFNTSESTKEALDPGDQAQFDCTCAHLKHQANINSYMQFHMGKV